MPKLELELTRNGYGSTIKIDGQTIHNVRGIKLVVKAGEVTHAELDVLLLDGATISVEGAEVVTRTFDSR